MTNEHACGFELGAMAAAVEVFKAGADACYDTAWVAVSSGHEGESRASLTFPWLRILLVVCTQKADWVEMEIASNMRVLISS